QGMMAQVIDAAAIIVGRDDSFGDRGETFFQAEIGRHRSGLRSGDSRVEARGLRAGGWRVVWMLGVAQPAVNKYRRPAFATNLGKLRLRNVQSTQSERGSDATSRKTKKPQVALVPLLAAGRGSSHKKREFVARPLQPSFAAKALSHPNRT